MLGFVPLRSLVEKSVELSRTEEVGMHEHVGGSGNRGCTGNASFQDALQEAYISSAV